jgi:oxygen-independent coproporphyrinogen-3 oxidase
LPWLPDRPPVDHLYIHVPFCARRCTYCDFSIAVRSTTPVEEYLEALGRELEQTRSRAAAPPRTVYLGGGTPSKLGGEGIARLAALIGRGAGADEFTIEANPEDVTAESARAWREAGINRISIGAQSFDDSVLAWMHRTHSAEAIPRAVRAAREGGIANISLDLIFSLPESLGRVWREDLARAVALEPGHISLYGLTVEEHTPLSRQILRGQSVAAPDLRYEEEYLLAHEVLGRAGYGFYEVSNASRPGREAVHNRAYWRRVPYLGLGPSAHSFDGKTRWWNEAAYAKWVDLLSSGESVVAGRETLNERDREMERLYLGLRTVDGIDVDGDLAERLLPRARQWVTAGWAAMTALGTAEPGTTAATAATGRRYRLALTTQGWLRLDQLVASI